MIPAVHKSYTSASSIQYTSLKWITPSLIHYSVGAVDPPCVSCNRGVYGRALSSDACCHASRA